VHYYRGSRDTMHFIFAVVRCPNWGLEHCLNLRSVKSTWEARKRDRLPRNIMLLRSILLQIAWWQRKISFLHCNTMTLNARSK